MKYEARPIQKNKNTLKAESYEDIIKAAEAALLQDPSNPGYLIMEHVATLTTQVSVAVERYNNVAKVESPFDPKPDDIPEPPEGFVYFGKKPITENSFHVRDEIAYLNRLSDQPHWVIGAHGAALNTHYAISDLSLALTAAKEQKTMKNNKL